MAYTTDIQRGGQVDVRTVQLRPAASRSDVFTRFLALQKSLKARSFAVLKIAGSSVPGKRKLLCDIENCDPAFTAGAEGVTSTYGTAMLEHIETSILPLAWSAQDGSSIVEMPDMAAFVVQLKPWLLPSSGIAFPTRLGTIGNGYVVFESDKGLDLPGDVILDMHGRCTRLMIDMLALDERRSVPAESLSDREIACLQLAGDGRISEEIADRLGLSVHTVNAYLGSATIKLDSVNRIQAIAKAIRLGYIN